MRFLALLFFLLAGLDGWAKEIPHQFVVTFKTVAAARAFQSPKTFKRVMTYKEYVVVLAMSGDEKAEVEKLRRLKGVQSVDPDVAFHSASAYVGDVVTGTANSSLENANSGAGVCSMGIYCPKAQQDLDWSEQLVNADLMNSELRNNGIDGKLPKIALIDSGVDPDMAEAMSSQGKIEYAKGYNSTDLDKGRHGNKMVQHLLWAAPGSTIASYGIYNRNGEAGSIQMKKALDDACDEKHPIINLSAESTKEVDGVNHYVPLESSHTALRNISEEMCQRGCYIVSAAGNYRGANDKGRVLTVGAIDQLGKASPDFAIGNVMAPGINVPVYLSIAGVARTPDGCGTDLKSVNGTSEATPIVSAIAKQTLAVLNKSRGFTGLTDKCERMTYLDRILRTSAFNKRADGYRAVLLAEQVGKDLDAGHTPSVDQSYAKVVFANALPAHSTDKCNTIEGTGSGCSKRLACYQEKRRHVALSDVDSSENTLDNVKDLYLTARKSGNPILTQYWEELLNTDSTRAWLRENRR